MKIKFLLLLLLVAGCAAPPAARVDATDSEASLASPGQQVWAYHLSR